ncbi:hypothetical protein BDV12DRAFT_194771 [Aspergillus spectabilis]
MLAETSLMRVKNIIRIKLAKGRFRGSKINIGLVLSILMLAIFSLTISVVHYTRQEQPGITTPIAIGGRFSAIQANIIDFLCTAVLTPLLMLVLDYIWFSNVRLSVLNEKSSGCAWVLLPSRVEASTTARVEASISSSCAHYPRAETGDYICWIPGSAFRNCK